VGTAASNQALSEKRAQAVVSWLTGHGVAASRLQAKGWGQSKPVADNGTEDGKAKNRRVELVKIS
jgi:outer membrane protein OmpA-like peptidoglycan-associated protein